MIFLCLRERANRLSFECNVTQKKQISPRLELKRYAARFRRKWVTLKHFLRKRRKDAFVACCCKFVFVFFNFLFFRQRWICLRFVILQILKCNHSNETSTWVHTNVLFEFTHCFKRNPTGGISQTKALDGSIPVVIFYTRAHFLTFVLFR